ncbi:MAG TPA: AMP-binding protein [Roseiarcus sp.]|jgi:long-chain acyl-CoA synthetase|nr:AMP-binding protein [Roseiarcus sp.]
MERIWLKSYPEGVPAEIDASAVGSLGDFIKTSFEKFRDRIAFISMGKAMSYGELDLKSRAFASYLQNVARLPRGARVALMLPNLLQYPIAAFGALRAGCVVVNCNPLYSPRELKHQLADSGAEAIVVLENFASTLEKAIGGTSARVVVVTGAGDQLGGVRGLMVNFVLRHVRRAVPASRLPQAISFNRALALGSQRSFAEAPIAPGEVAFLQYTGGTTGVPKGAMLTHRNMVANLRQIYAWLAPAIRAEGEMFVAALPLYHVFALQVNGFVPLMIGASNLMIANPRDIPALVKALRRTQFTAIPGVNTLFNALLNNKDFARLDFSRLHLAIGGGMAVQRAVAERWQSTTGKPLIEAYGLTETSPGAIANPLDIDHFTGAIGLPMPSTDIVIRDDDGRDLKLGEAGELCIKGPQVMAGYWNRPDETAKVMTADGFLRTGDIARVDERGFVYIVDRKKDMINVSGFNVYPNEIEDVAMGHPGVLEAGAVGVPDAKTGEAVKLVVVRKDPMLTEADLVAYCRQYLTGYKVPRHVEFRDTLPKTNIGKILRRELREEDRPAKG